MATVASAVVNFVGDFQAVDAGLDMIPGKALPIAKKFGTLFNTNLASGLTAGGGAMTMVGGLLVAASAPIEKAQATLKAAVEETGKTFDETYKVKVEAAIKVQERFGHGSADTQEALAKLTVGFKDPQKALEEMSRAAELAAMKHISLSEAAGLLVKTHAGATRGLKDFGINIKDSTTLLADATKATKAHDVAVAGLDKATAALSTLEARDAGVKKLSVAQQQQLAAAHKAVSDAQVKLTITTDAKAKAEAAAQGVTKNGEQIFNKLIDNYHGAEAQSETFGGRLDAVKTKLGDFAGEMGGKAGPALAMMGPALMTVGGILQLVTTFQSMHTASVAAGTVATEANTGVSLLGRIGMMAGSVATGIMTAAQWALNVALDANPIGLVVIAIAALIAGFVLAYQHVGWFRDGVNALWNAFKDFVGFLGGAFRSALDAVQGPIKAVGDVLNAINPFAHHSPSLVENVIAGTDIIKGRYTSLSGMQLSAPSIGGVTAGAMPSLSSALATSGDSSPLTAEGLRTVLTDMERERLQRPVVMDKNALLRAFGSLMADFDNGNKRGILMRPA